MGNEATAKFLLGYLWFLTRHLPDHPARMPGVVMCARDPLASLQLDAQRREHINFGEDAGARLEAERTAFTLHTGEEKFIALPGEPGLRVAGDADDDRAVALERRDGRFHLARFSAVRDRD